MWSSTNILVCVSVCSLTGVTTPKGKFELVFDVLAFLAVGFAQR